MSGLENGFFDRLFAIKSARSRDEAFRAAHGYFSDVGFSSTVLGYADLSHSADHHNQLRIDRLNSLVIGGKCDSEAYLSHYNRNHLWDYDLAAKPYHFGNHRPFLYGGRFSDVLAHRFLDGDEDKTARGNAVSAELMDAYCANSVCHIPIFTPVTPKIPSGHLVLTSEQDDPATKAILKRTGIMPVMIAYAFTEAMFGEFRRLFAQVKKLSNRERECLQFIASGLRPQQIAYRIGISTHTVEFHLKSARLKLGAKSLPHAVSKAIAYDEIEI